jgi:nucleoside-diphosphate-sugar epimerase
LGRFKEAFIMTRTALIIGATGAFGSHAAVALARHGWRLRALARDPQSARERLGANMPIAWIAGDAMNEADVIAAAAGADVIIHAANPPGYRNWRGTVPAMLASAVAAARASGARLVVPGTLYNYAPDSGPTIGEDAPQRPATRKGAIRTQAEVMLEREAATGLKVLVLRAGDFFGPAAGKSSMFDAMARRRAGRLTGLMLPGKAGHCFAYLPDLAEALARLLEREGDLEPFARYHFAGHWLESGAALAAAVRRASGRPDLPIRPFPWLLVWAAAPFATLMRELLEMRYLWDKPIGMDGGKLAACIDVPATPLDAALAVTLADLLDRSGEAVSKPRERDQHGGAGPVGVVGVSA